MLRDRKLRTIAGGLLALNMVLLAAFQVLRGGRSYDSLYGWVGNLTMVVPTAPASRLRCEEARAAPRRSGSGSRCSRRRPAT